MFQYFTFAVNECKSLAENSQVAVAISASLSYFIIGTVRGWASPAIPSLQGFDGANNSISFAPFSDETASWISKGQNIFELYVGSPILCSIFNLEKTFTKIKDNQSSIIHNPTSLTASLAPLGAIFGSLAASIPLTHLGRRGTLVLTSVLFLAGHV